MPEEGEQGVQSAARSVTLRGRLAPGLIWLEAQRGGLLGRAAPLLVLRPENLVPVEGGLLALPLQVSTLMASASIQARLSAPPFILVQQIDALGRGMFRG